jgi:hypothetical protein
MLLSWRFWLIIFTGFYLITNPAGAARMVHKGTGAASHAGHSLSTFVNRL